MLTTLATVKGYHVTLRTTRRERVRDATTIEIKQTARRLLVEHGPEALTLRAIAREMGMTAPALYRYFDSHEAVVGAVCADCLDELTCVLTAARDAVPGLAPVERLGAACRAFRRWSLDHPREFQLTFATPPPADDAAATLPPAEQMAQALSFGAVFLGIFVEIWHDRPFPVPAEEDLDPTLVAQLASFRDAVGGVLPVGALLAYLAGWVRLYGAVTVEVFGHLHFALTDPEAMFEAMLADMGRQLGAATG